MYVALLPALSLLSAVCASLFDSLLLKERQLPANATGVKTITSPGGVTVRYKNPAQDGVCEATPGVNSYSGYVDLDENTHMFFWFFEARHDAANAPLTLWLSGGPGADSLLSLFLELGPCIVTESLKPQANPYSWSEVSNLLFLSQPVGVGFSYAYEVEQAGDGRFPHQNIPTAANTTDEAAAVTWHVLQAFLNGLPQFDSSITSKTFNLWTESYGGHYGPAFFSYFEEQNAAIADGTQNGTQLIMDTLGIGNGIIDMAIQAPYYPEFAANNTYGIKAVNDTAYTAMKAAFYDPGMCKDQIAVCAAVDRSSSTGQSICRNAAAVCQTFVEYPYYNASGRGLDDIRQPHGDSILPFYFVDYLNQDFVQQAIGVNLNYTVASAGSDDVHGDFVNSGDLVYPGFKADLEYLLNNNVRVSLYHGDADYICNWFGGEAVSLSINYTHSAHFRAAGYAPFIVNGTEYGSVRQYGNFSFTRIYEAGHGVPIYQPLASLELFRRVLANKAISDGVTDVTGTYGTMGDANSTHTESTPASTCSGSSTVTSGSGGICGASATSATTSPSISPSGVTSGAQRRIHMLWKP